jgi:ribosomal protein S21
MLPNTVINAEINKTGNENALSMLRKFNRRIQGMGLVRHTRDGRYYVRPPSQALKKKRALKRIAKIAIIKQLIKDGKMPETTNRNAPTTKKE